MNHILQLPRTAGTSALFLTSHELSLKEQASTPHPWARGQVELHQKAQKHKEKEGSGGRLVLHSLRTQGDSNTNRVTTVDSHTLLSVSSPIVSLARYEISLTNV